MSNFFYRTEDIKPDEVHNYFVESNEDRKIIESLKDVPPVILVGSRGVGKSFLFRMAQYELNKDFESKKILPVYVTFRGSCLIDRSNQGQFHKWMLAKICNEILRALRKRGLMSLTLETTRSLSGDNQIFEDTETSFEKIAKAFENSWKTQSSVINTAILPDIDVFLNAIEDICEELGIQRIKIFIDEAAHVFIAEQQRQFFTLYRDLRSPYLTCNAAVYPGVTVYGDSFQPSHDAVMINLSRDVQEENYLRTMKEIVLKQSEGDKLAKIISERGENFKILAYAASGNPRHLLKTITKAQNLTSKNVNNIFRDYYRVDIWSEHSQLAEKYSGHKSLIDWGRNFIEDEVLPSIKEKNDSRLTIVELAKKSSSSYFWVHRDVPENIKNSLRLLEYTGILKENGSGIKGTRKQVGNRYFVNLGLLLSLESTPTSNGLEIINFLSPRIPTEYGINNKLYKEIEDLNIDIKNSELSTILKDLLAKKINVLDLPKWQTDELKKIGMTTIEDILRASEDRFKEIFMVGEIRARRISNSAKSAVYEYLSD
ncbi:hypothetical protein UAW_03059 [Enterococcus haemoperoxidus ATCC BAA-382]|uniref:RNA polymerase alpha subunit C-terminal domain-containing protein n=1 Tax=Enterococcus haemoperoxidus ATCC BAA-382 TaxID=1158608 RepID=R2SWG1_9ENTE|nr:hypothetical protein [Enterococcus haemoperoxidus]EOH92394.1 hypothetical protein UAW_03059 [Enterococcus haemoperoxidus ATCC BAA-382]EOT61760.1 hypothetical protein I583_00742 [Enterococcus haemoperoxidus ATCC BAA-382]OJG53967.1 hypothetical protein RV06_GL000586 [Enterococcus haemoperoxidus]